MIRRFVYAVLAAAALAAVPACEDAINEESYGSIEVGMDMAAVESILGGPGDIQEAAGVGIDAGGMTSMQREEGSAKEYLWGDETTGILVRFEDGRVVHKRKLGF
ncbi:MAG TPA: hypothetical protein VFF69_05345 [Phycisphaerales bacterium]|nr:hypothetical protein [Phycisphaerales bacterium]